MNINSTFKKIAQGAKYPEQYKLWSDIRLEWVNFTRPTIFNCMLEVHDITNM